MTFVRLFRKSGAIALTCLGGLVAVTACSSGSEIGNGSSDALGQSSEPIEGGTVDSVHDYVFLLVRQDQMAVALCSASLIAPNLLLTARHCTATISGEHVVCGTSTFGDPYPVTEFITTNDVQPSNASKFYKIKDIREPGPGNDACGFDVSLIILDENVPASMATPAIPRIDRAVTPGELYTAVGYGTNGTGKLTGSRMERGALQVTCEPGTCGPGVESTEFRGQSGACQGDSGGPALDADGKVVGVDSRGTSTCDGNIYGTVTAWQDFIVATAQDAAKLGGYDPPFWVTTRSSDPPMTPGPGAGGADGAGGASGVSGAPDAGPPPLAALGADCGNSKDCEAGLVCLAPAVGQRGTCTTKCASATDCAAGQECRAAGDISVCTTPAGAHGSKGCALATPPGGPSSGALGGLLLGAALGASLWRRRKL